MRWKHGWQNRANADASYQPGGQAGYNPEITADALSNGTVCLRDAALMQMLGVCILQLLSAYFC